MSVLVILITVFMSLRLNAAVINARSCRLLINKTSFQVTFTLYVGEKPAKNETKIQEGVRRTLRQNPDLTNITGGSILPRKTFVGSKFSVIF